jgi:mRNA interferase RelE/StbE
MQILKLEEFLNCYAALPGNIQKKTEKALLLLSSNPRHPSLRVKKLEGFEDVWYGRINKNYRFTFQKGSEVLIMRRVGTHDFILKNP